MASDNSCHLIILNIAKYNRIHHIWIVPVVSFSCLPKMAYLMRIFLVIFIWIFVPKVFIKENSGKTEIILNSRGKCPNEEKNPVRYDGNITRIGLNKYSFNGTFTIDRNITADLLVSRMFNCFSRQIKQLLFLKKKVPGYIQTLQSDWNKMRRLR